ncbi:hypothetical protein [Streptomyces virginiae]|uniref:hypothetical protein n=1 Tax=Streptomyces virginiae TaxID=1961 RepID=UPI00370202A4
MKSTQGRRIPAYIGASCLAAALTFSTGASIATAAHQAPVSKSMPAQGDSDSDQSGTDTSGSDTGGQTDTSNQQDTDSSHPRTNTNNQQDTDPSHPRTNTNNQQDTDPSHPRTNTNNQQDRETRGRVEKGKKCPANTGPPPHCAVLKNPPGLKIPAGAKMPVTSSRVTITIQKLVPGPHCSLRESMVAVQKTTYIGYVYADANGRKYEKKYPTWSYGKGNHTVSGPYTVINTVNHPGAQCISKHLVGGGH